MTVSLLDRADPAALHRHAEAMLNCRIGRIDPMSRGANSAVYRLHTADGNLALKVFPRRPGETHDRVASEWRALRLFAQHGVTAAPRPVAVDENNAVLLMEWIDGHPVAPIGPAELTAALRFIANVFALSTTAAAADFPPAAEACLSGTAIAGQIDARLNAFIPDPELQAFLDGRYRALLSRALDAAAAPDFARDLEARRLIPADFGFHNAIRRPDGGVVFFDFDYMGWDDPVKLVGDFVLHPAMDLSDDLTADFMSAVGHLVGPDTGYWDRLHRYLPLLGLRWALILLNPYRRDRQHNGPLDPEIKDCQLRKASLMCDRVERLLVGEFQPDKSRRSAMEHLS